MKHKIKTKKQTKPARRKITNFIAFVKFFHAYRKVIITCLIFVLISSLWGFGYFNKTYQYSVLKSQIIFKSLGFNVKDILVEGREHTSPSQILSSLGVKRGESIFSLNPEQAQKQLESLSWVNSAMVQRRLPHTIYIRLVERRPLAIWQNKGKYHLIDTKGFIINDFKASDFKHLIVLTGKNANKSASHLFTTLTNFPALQEKVKAAAFVSGRRWDLILVNNVRIKLPEKNLKDALKRLEKMNKQHHFANGGIATIDLRLKDRSFLYVKDGERDKKNKGDLT